MQPKAACWSASSPRATTIAASQITAKQLSVYDNGVEQTIRNFTPDPSPARIVLLVDNSLTIRADVEKLEQAAREFAYEIFEGDKLLIVGYDEQAEIVSDWTDDAKSIESSLKLFQEKGPAASVRRRQRGDRSGAAAAPGTEARDRRDQRRTGSRQQDVV